MKIFYRGHQPLNRIRLLLNTLVLTCLACGASLSLADGQSGFVKITPLGSHDGEFCRLDRALVFEDPDGTRILYDAGRTVAGADDERLGRIDAVLVSHVHGDHIGDKHISRPNVGTCAKPQATIVATPDSNTVRIARAKRADIITGSEMPKMFAKKLAAKGGDPKKSRLVRFGAEVMSGGVKITTVPAAHSNGLAPAFLTGPVAEYMSEAGVTFYVGPPTGYVLTFTNGLSIYLSGDTGITAEQEDVVGKYYKPQLTVINIGGTFTTGPTQAAFVIDELVKSRSVIASHANEPATKDGKVLEGTRTEAFIKAVAADVYLPLSGREMQFNGQGVCKLGCS